jgi:hypothetical protein
VDRLADLDVIVTGERLPSEKGEAPRQLGPEAEFVRV